MTTLVRSAACICLAALLAAPAAATTEPGDVAAREVLAAARQARPGSSAALPRHPEAALRLFVGDADLPVDDLTPLLVQALSDPRALDAASREALGILLERPRLPGALALAADGVRVHWAPPGLRDTPSPVDRDRDGVPDVAAAALEGLVAARQEAASLGLGAALDDGDGVFDLYLVSLGGLVSGYTAPLAPARAASRWPAFGVLDPAFAGGTVRVRSLAARLYARAVGFAWRGDAPAWWSEPAALWLEERATGSAGRYDAWIARRRVEPESTLLEPGLGRARGNLDLLHTLDARGDGRWVRAVWRASSEAPGEPLLEVLDRVTRGERPAGAGVDRVLGDLAARAAVESERGDGPPLRLAASHDAYPVVAIETSPALEPLGTSVVAFEADDEDGGLRLALEGGAGASWAADLLLRSRRDGSFTRTRLDVSESGRGEIGLPWGDFDRALLLVRNLSPAGAPSLYTYTATPEPHYPFVAGPVGAQAQAGGSRTLTWETSREQDLFGWLVLRAPSADGPWRSVTPFPLPALGARDEPASYHFVDDDALDPGQRAHYRIVGLTREGLTRTLDVPALAP